MTSLGRSAACECGEQYRQTNSVVSFRKWSGRRIQRKKYRVRLSVSRHRPGWKTDRRIRRPLSPSASPTPRSFIHRPKRFQISPFSSTLESYEFYFRRQKAKSISLHEIIACIPPISPIHPQHHTLTSSFIDPNQNYPLSYPY